jgi:MFS family permease
MLVWKGVNEQTAAFYVSLMFFLSIPLRFGLGLAGGLFSPRKVVFAGMSIGALGLLGMLTLEGVPAVVGLVVALAVVEGVTSVNWITVSDYFGRSRFASLMGVMSAFLNLGSATAPVLSGWAFDRTQSYNLVLATCLPLFLAGGIVFALARPPTLPRPRIEPGRNHRRRERGQRPAELGGSPFPP